MKLITEILGIACFAWLFAEIVMPIVKQKIIQVQYWKEFGDRIVKIKRTDNRERLKPFDCPLCLSWWLGLIIFEIQSPGLMPILYAATGSVTATFISKLLNRI